MQSSRAHYTQVLDSAVELHESTREGYSCTVDPPHTNLHYDLSVNVIIEQMILVQLSVMCHSHEALLAALMSIMIIIWLRHNSIFK